MTINIKFSKEDITKIKTDLVVVECKKRAGEEKKAGMLLKTDGGMALDNALNGAISRLIEDERFTGDVGDYKIIQTHGKIVAKNVMVIGVGEEKEFDNDVLRKIGAKITKIANQLHAVSAAGVLQPENVKSLSPEKRVLALAEGIILGDYRFDRYKDKKDLEEKTFKTISIIYKGASSSLEKAVNLGTEVALAINYARELVNTPGDDMTPEVLAGEAVKISKAKGLSCNILDEKAIRQENMRLILAVSRGSKNPPRLIHIKYAPTKKAKTKIAIVGKGVTFDTGGYNLKNSKNMENMKSDMAGAATVLAIMKLMPLLKPNVSIEAYIPASENMIGSKAQKPGDVIKSRNGKTVELWNMDAEGRLVLADAMDYALECKPDILIDIATLTGGVRYALGEIYTAILGNDQRLIDKLIDAGKEGGEPIWQLPIVKEYMKGLKDGIADLNNTGKSYAQTILGALFLQEFIGKTKWAHLDIAETAWAEEERDYRAKGGTGSGVQTIIKFLEKY